MKFSTALAPRGSRPGGSGGRRATRPETFDVQGTPAGRGPPRQGATARTAAAATPPGRCRGAGRGPAGPRPRRCCRRGRSGTSAAARERSSAGSRAPGRSTAARRQEAPTDAARGPSSVADAFTAVVRSVRRTARRPESRSSPSDGRRCLRGRRAAPGRPDGPPAAGSPDAVADQMAQPAGDAMPHDRATDRRGSPRNRPAAGVRRVRGGGSVADAPPVEGGRRVAPGARPRRTRPGG